jgi:hypothetical protein
MPMAETGEFDGDLSKGISLSTAMLAKLQTLPILSPLAMFFLLWV